MRLWDADSGDRVGVHVGRVGDKATHLAVSRDGRFAAIAIQTIRTFREQLPPGNSTPAENTGGRTEVIDLATGELVFSSPSLHLPTWDMFGADDRSVIMGSSAEVTAGMSRVHLLDARSGKTIVTRELAGASG
ncbi:MAG: hypothetical protein ACKVS9_04910 [Phycisphaerae bacterium]